MGRFLFFLFFSKAFETFFLLLFFAVTVLSFSVTVRKKGASCQFTSLSPPVCNGVARWLAQGPHSRGSGTPLHFGKHSLVSVTDPFSLHKPFFVNVCSLLSFYGSYFASFLSPHPPSPTIPFTLRQIASRARSADQLLLSFFSPFSIENVFHFSSFFPLFASTFSSSSSFVFSILPLLFMYFIFFLLVWGIRHRIPPPEDSSQHSVGRRWVQWVSGLVRGW